MAKKRAAVTRKPSKAKAVSAMVRTASFLLADVPPSCEDLYAIAEATAQLIAQHCPIAAKKK